MRIIAVPDQPHLDALLADLHDQGVRDRDISLIRRHVTPANTTVITETDGPLEGNVPVHSVTEAMKEEAQAGMPEGAAIGVVTGALVATPFLMLGPVGWIGLLGFAAVGGGVGALSGLGLGAASGALEKASEETVHQEIVHEPTEAVGNPVIEGNFTEPTLTPEQQNQGREIVENGGALIHVDEAKFPQLNLAELASKHSGYLL